ncbi:MAG: geranylgeranylglyceryl/heptaprenylglyceryl phosphate synthase [Candidatus Micrarchaeota archaeon]|nr:geranylgeranylglyceryl/heptaprenylglyceryl phosphate synthase [Candidatus Micrarchaeota archaeon]
MENKIEKYIKDRLKKEKLLFALIDPLDYKDNDHAIRTAVAAAEGGAAVILVGGSIGVQGEMLDNIVKEIKSKVKVPVVLFPGNIATLTKYADAVYFMSLLNSRNPYWISQAQMLASPVIKQLGIEPISIGYIVVEPGGSVGWVGDVNLVPRDRPKIGAALALAGEYLGSKFILMDVGSASKIGHVPLEMIAAVKKTISIPLIIAGGIKSPEDAENVVKAGADIIQVGTILEESEDPKKLCQEIVKRINKR